MAMKAKIKNSALFCSICKETTENLKTEGITCIRLLEDNSTNKHVTICSLCLNNINNQINPNNHKKSKSHLEEHLVQEEEKTIITPKFIYHILEKNIIGQDRAKRAISLAVATHLRRIENPLIEKSNILLLGPTGTGKTELARTIAKRLNLPLVIADATTFTAHGYVGEDVESILISLLQNAHGKVDLAEKGIVFIDEIDKISQKINEHSVNSSAVQQSLLKMIEGGKVRIPKTGLRKDVGNEMVTIDTSKILFICSGAFSGLEKIIKESCYSNTSNHIITENSNLIYNNLIYNPLDPFENVSEKHLIDFGIIPEFLGRLPVITSTSHLTTEALISILSEPENSLSSQYKILMKAYGIELEYSHDFYESVAKEAHKKGMGARSLRKVMESRLEEILFNGPDQSSQNILITADKIIYKKKKKPEIKLSIQ